jgi:CheY-like chemotaxis protein
MVARVLVVDDDEAIRVLVTRLFQRRGYEVASAQDGADAIRQLDADPFDLVLLDLMMPLTDGATVACHIVSSGDGDGRQQPGIIIMSAAVPSVLEQLPRDHIWKVITKPFRVDALLEEAEAALAHRARAG